MRFKNDFPVDKDPVSIDQIIEKLPSILTKVLIAVAGIVLISGIIAFAVRHDKAGENYRKADPSVQKVINTSKRHKETLSAYTKLGQMRISLRSDEPGSLSVLVLSPWFSYSDGDTAFTEELNNKERQLKAIITDYFACYTKQELKTKGELSVKDDLKNAINDTLVLNEIKNIYFDEYVFF